MLQKFFKNIIIILHSFGVLLAEQSSVCNWTPDIATEEYPHCELDLHTADITAYKNIDTYEIIVLIICIAVIVAAIIGIISVHRHKEKIKPAVRIILFICLWIVLFVAGTGVAISAGFLIYLAIYVPEVFSL